MNFIVFSIGIAFGAMFHSQVVLLWIAMRETFVNFIG